MRTGFLASLAQRALTSIGAVPAPPAATAIVREAARPPSFVTEYLARNPDVAATMVARDAQRSQAQAAVDGIDAFSRALSGSRPTGPAAAQVDQAIDALRAARK